MAEIPRLLLRPAAFALLIAAAVISLFFTIRNEHAKWEGSAAVMETDAMILRTEYIRQMETLKELDLLIMTMTNMASGIQAYTFAADPLRIDNNGS